MARTAKNSLKTRTTTAAAKRSAAPKKHRAAPEPTRSPEPSNISEQQLRLATESAGIGFWQLDLATGQASVSENYARIIGLPDGERTIDIQTAVGRLAHPDDAPRLRSAMDATMRGQGDLHLEVRMVHPVTRQVLWLEVHGTLIPASATQGARIAGVARNITPRKQAEAELRTSEEKYRTLFNSMDEGYSTLEVLFAEGKAVDYRFIETNPALTHLTGLSNVIGKRATEILPTLSPESIEQFAQVVLTGEPRRFTLHVPELDSWFEIYATRSGDAGSPFVNTVYRNITERKRMDDALRESEARQSFLLRFGDTLRSIQDPLEIQRQVVHTLGEYMQVDRAYFAEIDEQNGLLVVHHDHVRGDTPSLVGAYPIARVPVLVDVLRRGAPIIVADPAQDPDIPAAESAYMAAINVSALIAIPLRHEGHAVAALAVAQVKPRYWTSDEIMLMFQVAQRTWTEVERARVARALNDSEERVQLALKTANMGTFVWYPDSDTTEPDQRMLELFGLKADTDLTLSAALATLLHPDDRIRYAQAVARSLDPSSLGLLNEDIRVLQPDGSQRWIAIHARTYFDDSTPPHAVRMAGMATDVSNRKVLEQALQDSKADLEARVAERTRELGQLNAERKDLLQQLLSAQEEERRRISLELHDRLGQQLTAISIQLNLLELDMNAPERLSTRFPTMREQMSSTMDLVRSLAFELRPAALEYVGLPETLRNYVEEWALRFGHNVYYENIGFEGQSIPLDAATVLYRITQEALTNILRHARASNVSVILQRHAAEVSVIIEDDGVGFVLETDGASTDVPRSLGLLGMRERATLMGGTFEVESAPDVGTSIYVHLPLVPETPAP